MGSKPSRHHLEHGNESLAEESINEFCQETGFTKEEIVNWHKNFYKDCPDGRLTLKQFEHQYSKIMGKPTHKTSEYVKHMFSIYDQDKNQYIDFKEFVMALSAASVVNRLRLVETIFRMFDLDGDGKITKDEIDKMLHALVDVTNSNRYTHPHSHSHHRHREVKDEDDKQSANLQKRIDEAFNALNTNDDDHITQQEFIDWYMKSGLLSEVKANDVTISDVARLQQLDKKNRKLRKQHLNKVHNMEENSQRETPIRYMMQMKERKPNKIHGSDENNDDIEETDNDVHDEIEHDRWQHLFNSVLGQIRARHSQNQQNPIVETDNTKKYFNTWRQQAAEKIKSEYYKQNSTDYQLSPDIVSIRL